MTQFTIPKKTYVLLDEGTYLAEITRAEQEEGQFGSQVKFEFTLLDTDEEATLTGWASATYSDKSKLFKWTKAALGPEFDPNEDFDSTKILGCKVMLNVSRRMGTNGSEFNKIEDLIPIRKKPRPANQVKQELGIDEGPSPWQE